MILQFDMHNPLYDMASVIFYKNVAIQQWIKYARKPEDVRIGALNLAAKKISPIMSSLIADHHYV